MNCGFQVSWFELHNVFDLARMMLATAAEIRNFVTLDVRYTQIGLLSFRVEDSTDLGVAIAEHERSKAAARALKRMADLANGVSAKRRRSQRGRRVRKEARAGEADAPAADRGGEAGEAEADEAVDDLDDDSAGASSDEDSGDSSGGTSIAEPVIADGDDGEDGEDADGEDAEAAGAVDEAPFVYHVDTGQVIGRDGVPWGRISVIREGTPREAVAIYCRRHGCQLMKLCSRCPSHPDILDWFVRGQAVPKGRSPALQGHHKRMWPDP